MSIIDQHIRAAQLNEVLSGRTFTAMEITQHFETQLRIGFSKFNGLEAIGQKIHRVFVDGDYIVIAFETGVHLFWAGKETLYHPAGEPMPNIYGIRLVVEDGASLTIHIPGMQGCLFITTAERYRERKDFSVHTRSSDRLSALDPESFTFERFKEHLLRKNAFACSAFTTIANIGYLPDVLFTARINPRTRVASLSESDLHRLYTAVRDINQEIFSKHGEVLEKDVYGQPGGYARKMAGHLSKKPCPTCATPVEKTVNITGQAFYFCPTCQPFLQESTAGPNPISP